MYVSTQIKNKIRFIKTSVLAVLFGNTTFSNDQASVWSIRELLEFGIEKACSLSSSDFAIKCALQCRYVYS